MGGGLENPPPLKTFYQGNKKPMVRPDSHAPLVYATITNFILTLTIDFKIDNY